MVSRYARKAGIDRPVWPHQLRHTYATDLLDEGFNIRAVQTLLRHADVRTTEIYTHVSDAELREKVRRRRARPA
jgi:integrase/recombinase XerD